MDFVKKNKKYIALAGCAIMAIAVFLTFVKASALGMSESLKFTKVSDEYSKCISAYVVLIAAAGSAALIWFNKEKYSLITSAAALVITFYDYFKVKDEMDALGSLIKTSYTAPWVVLVGFIIAIAPIVIDILEEKGIIKSK